MSQHTRGPWKCVRLLSGSENDKGFRISARDDRDGWVWIADVSPVIEDERGDASEQGKANARLITAAPKMLAALLKVEWEGWTVGGEDPPVPCCPSCGAYRADVRIEPEEATSDANPGVHVKGCQLAAALAAAEEEGR